MIFVFVHGGPEKLPLYAFCVWVIQGYALDHIGLVLAWTGIQLAGEVGVGSWVLRAVPCVSVLCHQSGLHPDLDPYPHLLLPWRSFALWCVADSVLY